MNTSKTFTVSFIAALLASTTLYAAEAQTALPPIQMVSGGVGDAGMDDIAATQNHYTVKLIFAEPTGEYLADIEVQVRDKKGSMVVNTTSGGPILLMNLKPGLYTVSSTIAGETKAQRIVVHGKGLNSYYIHLHSA